MDQIVMCIGGAAIGSVVALITFSLAYIAYMQHLKSVESSVDAELKPYQDDIRYANEVIKCARLSTELATMKDRLAEQSNRVDQLKHMYVKDTGIPITDDYIDAKFIERCQLLKSSEGIANADNH